MNQWSRKDAQQHFDEVVAAARREPQLVKDGAETIAIVTGPPDQPVTADPPEKIMWQGREITFVELLRAMPHKEGFEIERARAPRRRDFEF